ncbi:ATP-binding protein [Streptomyces echinatus]|uniref:DNA-binding transcriptional ArsR family regulator n=1 Tax=Streptomyces echinatus TaxID=67293 RepID=A0A7W9Q429_9ACTN|nr:ATP-binding protein [Streptomyces echinatus]MBB5932427.1 DNA-binding transcriptional ArsR family regulator [Streptomyces echinatus]
MPQLLDQGKARTMDEFIGQLRLLKAWAGSPSITEITRRVHQDWRSAGRPRGEWPARSTVGDCFRVGRRRPNPDLLLAVVRVLAGDEAAVAMWRQALRTVLGEAEASARVCAYDRLPAGPSLLVGRSRPVSRTEAALAAEGRPGVVVMEGAAGVGKTSLALHLARRAQARKHADAPALFADLRGFAPDRPPADTAAVLDTFLRLLGAAGERIPHGTEARARRYRQLLAGTGAFVVLDDAADAEQVRPLLPGDPASATLITSRRLLHGLPDATRRTVGPPAAADSVELLRRTAGAEAVTADPTALRRIADDLGHLPLALTAVGHHIRRHPGWTLDDYDHDTVITLALEGGVRRALAASDAQVAPGARRLLRLLALHPRDRTGVACAVALAGEREQTVREHLDALSATHLLAETEPGRFRMHTLVRAYAEERVGIDVPGTSIRQALGRVRCALRDTAPTWPRCAAGPGRDVRSTAAARRRAVQWRTTGWAAATPPLGGSH